MSKAKPGFGKIHKIYKTYAHGLDFWTDLCLKIIKQTDLRLKILEDRRYSVWKQIVDLCSEWSKEGI